MFIVFDGIDGSGKSMHMKRTIKWFLEQNINVHFFHEPGSTKIGDQLRNIFLNEKMDTLSQLFLISCSRSLLVKQIYELAKDSIVLCDRYIDSTYAYQSPSLDKKLVDDCVNASIQVNGEKLLPDFTFLFLHRCSGRILNYMDYVSEVNQDVIISTFKERAAVNPEKYFTVPLDEIEIQDHFIQVKMKEILAKSRCDYFHI